MVLSKQERYNKHKSALKGAGDETMRIGKFAQSNEVSVDTIRHYMDLGLIVPEKKGGQYFFDNRCQTDLELIMEFKALGFHLNEIKLFFLYKNFGKLANYQEDPFYQSLYKEKYKKIDHEIKELTRIKDKLNSKLIDLSAKNIESSTTIGIDLKVLDFLKCLNCGQPLLLQDGLINNNQIIEGKLACACGNEHLIENGILIINEPFKSTSDNELENNIHHYIQLTDSSYLENINKGLHWSKRKLDQLDLHWKVILELGSGVGFFLRNIYQELPEDCLYIAVDHSLERHRFLKSLLERTNSKRNILFICADFLEIPIPKQSVDLLIDHSGTSNYSFDHEDFLLNKVDSLVKPDGHLLGSYFAFKNFSRASKIAVKFRDNFSIRKIKDHLAGLQYKPIDDRTSDLLNKGGQFEDFFVKGEEVFTYSFFGRKLQ